VRALVVTVVHTPEDARIRRRQITALLEAGWEVTFVAPWSAFGVAPDPVLTVVDVPRAAGRRRLRSLRAASRVVRRLAAQHDVVLVHDPDLYPLAWLRTGTPVVVDIHEDTAAALVDRPWVPGVVRWPVARVVRWVEHRLERRAPLLLAEDGYAPRFRRAHTVVPNLPPVPTSLPAPGERARAVYVGRVSVQRGVGELVAVGRLLAAKGIGLDVVGPADAEVEAGLRRAVEAGVVRWHGFLPNDAALALVDGALAGLSLLHDVPNYRVSAPTKVYEYLARGVPVVTTPLPLPADIVRSNDVGVVVGFGDAAAAAGAVVALRDDPSRRQELGARAHGLARERYDWGVAGPAFVEHLAAIAGRRERDVA
jgi:glycosyltransferase involved in cell wall biosynthesis